MPQPDIQRGEESRIAAEIVTEFRRAIGAAGLALLGEPELVTELERARGATHTLRLNLGSGVATPAAAPRVSSEVILSWTDESDIVEVEAYPRIFVPGTTPDLDAMAARAFAIARDRGFDVDVCRIGLEYAEGRPDPVRYSVAFAYEQTFSWELQSGRPVAADIERLCATLLSAMDGLASIVVTC